MEQNKKAPVIRFKGFEKEWKTEKLGEIGNTFTGLSGKTKEDFGCGEGKFITYMNVFSNPISSCKQLEKVGIDNGQNQVKYGDVLFTTSSETPQEVGMSSVWLHDFKNIYLNSFCFGYRPQNDIDSFYLAYLLRSNTFRSKMIPLAQGISRYNISKGKVMDLSISIPQKKEQIQIGELFKTIDDQITLQEQKHQKLINLKSVMLEKMFPKEGANVPEIRFNGFTEDWEEIKLGDIGYTFNGLSGKNKEDFGHGQAKFVTYLNVFKNTIADDSMVDRIEIDKYQNQVKYGDILFTISSETVKEIGMSSIWLNDIENVYLNSFCFGYRIIKNVDSYFIGYLLRSKSFRTKMIPLAQGISRYNISKGKVMQLSIYLPNRIEQQKIGAYFENLDHLISQSETQINKYKNIKQALLQKMFV